MKTIEDMVREFHRAAGLKLPDNPTLDVDDFFASPEVRQSFLDEEVRELRDAEESGNLVEIADAIADIVYFAVGTAITYGVPFDAVFTEVHRSNMTKFDANGNCEVRSDGKILKGPHYDPPHINQVFETTSRKVRG